LHNGPGAITLSAGRPGSSGDESMHNSERTPPWLTDERAAWLEETTRWIVRTIGALGLGPRADVSPIRERQWGAVLRVETPERTLFFKAEGVGARHEPAIVADIASTHPQLVPSLLAADLGRAWLLMADEGSPMLNTLDAAAEIAIWEDIFPTYARMQRTHASSVERWIDAGTPDRRVHHLPALLDGLLADVPLDGDGLDAIKATFTDLEAVCDELGAATFAHAIDHSDMHAGNILIGRDKRCLADWGDACITHPFVSPFVTYQHAVPRLPASDRPAAARRLRDVYLEPWGEGASGNDLRDAFAKATWLGHIVRALNFAHQLAGPGEWGPDVARFLVRWQEQRTLLGRGDELIAAIASEAE
jgi:hypothetical protein